MKTIPLTELLAKATPGPYRTTKHEAWDATPFPITSEGGSFSIRAAWVNSHLTSFDDNRAAYTQALLAHAANHIGPLVEALEEVKRRTQMLIYQNTGRWDMHIEHDARTYNVCESNCRIIEQALAAAKNVEVGT